MNEYLKGIVYNKENDDKNIKKFKRYMFVDEEANIFKCVICNEKTSLSHSMSNQGHKLVCNYCIHQIFGGSENFCEWRKDKYDN